MKMQLFPILFFPGVISITFVREYHLIQQVKNWNDAQAYCRATYDDLATMETASDITKLQSMSSFSAWVGLYTERSGWHWSLNNESLGSVTQWNPNALLNGNQMCTVLTYYSGWWDTLCTYYLPFTCFDDRYVGNSRYIVINSAVTFFEAQRYCRQYHTDVASARDSTENSNILNAMAGNPLYSWIGLIRDPWKWSDQTTYSPIPWIYGKPNNDQGNENCAYFYYGQLSDAQCSDSLPFFCEKIVYPNQLQIIRVTVQTSQDANDPEVKNAILEKIQQKVKEHRLANTTVKWKEQLDGDVFRKEPELTLN